MTRSHVLVAASLLAVAGCSKGAKTPEAPAPVEKKGPPEVAEHEPNNDSRSAQQLQGSVQVKGSFVAGSKVDEDWYRLEAPSPTAVRLEVSPVSGTEIGVEVYDAEKNRVLRMAAPDGEAAVVPTVTCQGSCYFKIVPVKKDAGGPYTLTVTTSEPGPRSEKEPNNRYVDAQPLQLGAAIDGYVATGDDEDWYLLNPQGLQPDQVIGVTIASPPGVKLELVVARQSDQAPLATYRASEPGADLKLRDLAAPLAPETGYYLVVRSGYVAQPGGKGKRLADTKAAYTLEVKAQPGAANLESEPNDDAAHATVLGGAAPVAAAPATPVTTTASAPAPDAGAPAVPAAPAAAAAPATPANASYTVNGFLAPKGDVDWFRFHVDQPSIVRAEVTGLDKVNLVLALIDPAKKDAEKDNELAKADSGDVKEPETLAGIAVPAGDNYLRVDGAWKKVDDKWVKDYENTTDTYALTVTVAADDGTWEREPNDKPDKATPVEIGKDYKGFVQPAKDVDTYRLEVKEASNVALTLSAVPKLDLQIAVRDEKGAIVGTVDKNRVEAEERLVVPFEPGVYFVEVREKGKESNAQKPYTLSIK